MNDNDEKGFLNLGRLNGFANTTLKPIHIFQIIHLKSNKFLLKSLCVYTSDLWRQTTKQVARNTKVVE